MRRAILPVLAIALAAAPLTSSAQQPVPERGRMGAMPGMRGAPLGRILAQREALGLSEQQVTRIEDIRAALEAKNRPLLEQLRAAVPDSLRRPRREGLRERAAQLTPEQREEARERAREVRGRMEQLTPEERAAVREEMRERRRERAEQLTPEQLASMRERAQAMRERRDRRPRLDEEQLAVVRPIVEQLRENHMQALREARAVLTPEQQERLREGPPGAARFHRGERAPRRSPDAR